MKFYQRFIRSLYIRFCDVEITGLTEDLIGLTRNVIKVDAMDESKKKDFLSKCNQIYRSPAFREVIDSLTESQKNSTMEKAETEQHLLCGRMSIYGINSVYREFARYNKLFEEEKTKKEPFNPHEII